MIVTLKNDIYLESVKESFLRVCLKRLRLSFERLLQAKIFNNHETESQNWPIYLDYFNYCCEFITKSTINAVKVLYLADIVVSRRPS